ncbi:MAG: phosphoserine phosphatase SerB [Hyphomicrobiaceae bacterium]
MAEMLCRAVVITGDPDAGSVVPEVCREASSTLRDFTLLQEDVLSPGTACRALFVAPETLSLTELRDRVRLAFADRPLDINVVADDIAFTRKRLLVADMESTIIEQEMLDELAGEIGLRDKVAAITERAMRGELDFEAALNERVALLAGLDASILDRLTAERITLMPGAETLIATMKANGAYCALVSGGFTCFTAPVAKRLGFDEHQANTLEVIEGKITGRVIPPILGRAAKRAALERIAAQHGIDPVLTLAVGDGANDLDMLAAAGLGVAFRAKPKVREAALSNPGGAVITHGDLTALLYLQGYADREHIARAT